MWTMVAQSRMSWEVESSDPLRRLGSAPHVQIEFRHGFFLTVHTWKVSNINMARIFSNIDVYVHIIHQQRPPPPPIDSFTQKCDPRTMRSMFH
jgi:hypothetical protein